MIWRFFFINSISYCSFLLLKFKSRNLLPFDCIFVIQTWWFDYMNCNWSLIDSADAFQWNWLTGSITNWIWSNDSFTCPISPVWIKIDLYAFCLIVKQTKNSSGFFSGIFCCILFIFPVFFRFLFSHEFISPVFFSQFFLIKLPRSVERTREWIFILIELTNRIIYELITGSLESSTFL